MLGSCARSVNRIYFIDIGTESTTPLLELLSPNWNTAILNLKGTFKILNQKSSLILPT